MPIQSTLPADNGETIPLLADYSAPSSNSSTNAANSPRDFTQSNDKTEVESILNGDVELVPQTTRQPIVLPLQPAPEQFQGFRLHHAVALLLPLSVMLVLRASVRQVLNANTAVSIACLVLYQAMLPTLQMHIRIFFQSALWAVVPATRRSLHNGYLPLVLLPSVAMAWIWHETYLGRVASFAVHGVVDEPAPDTCPHGSKACQALFGMVLTTSLSALCFAAEIGLFWYIENGPHGNMWLEDGDERLMTNFLRGHRYTEPVQRLREEDRALQDLFATQDQLMTDIFLTLSAAQRTMRTAQLVDVGYGPVAPVPIVSAGHAFHIDFSSDDETVHDDESFRPSESGEDGDDDNDDDAKPYRVNTMSYAAQIETYTAAQMSAFAVDPLKTLSSESDPMAVDPVQPYSADHTKVESVSHPEILSPVPRRPRVSPLLYSQLSLTGTAYMPARSESHLMVQPPVAASFYREAKFEETLLLNVASPPFPLPLDAAVPAAVYSYDDHFRSIGSVALFKNFSNVDQECIRRRLIWAQAMVDKENAAVQVLLAMATSLSDDDEEEDGSDDGGDEDEGDSDESECSEEESGEGSEIDLEMDSEHSDGDSDGNSDEDSGDSDEDKEGERSLPNLAGTFPQETDEEPEWDIDALVAQAHAVQELLDEEARVLESFGFYSNSDDEGSYLVDNEGQVLAWLCGDKFSL